MAHANNSRLLAEVRRRKILELVEQSGQVTIPELVKRFAVSSVTVRSDLDVLSAKGALLRSHGGAVRYETAQDYAPRRKSTRRRPDISGIGADAAKLVNANQSVILGNGTATAEIAKQ